MHQVVREALKFVHRVSGGGRGVYLSRVQLASCSFSRFLSSCPFIMFSSLSSLENSIKPRCHLISGHALNVKTGVALYDDTQMLASVATQSEHKNGPKNCSIHSLIRLATIYTCNIPSRPNVRVSPTVSQLHLVTTYSKAYPHLMGEVIVDYCTEPNKISQQSAATTPLVYNRHVMRV